MAVALRVNWDLAKELYINGLPLARVAEKIGVKLDTLCARASRGAWSADVLQKEQPEALVVKTVAERLSNQTLTISERILCKVEKMSIGTPVDAKNIASAVAASYSTARKALGLDDNQVQRHVHVHVMDSCRSTAILDAEVIADSPAPVLEQSPADRLLPIAKPQ